jgi:uncharacterized protein (TIGR03118 family)
MFVPRPTSTHVFPARIAALIAVVLLLGISATAQYTQTNLTGDFQGEGKFVDPHLKNAWGIVPVLSSITGTFWVADQGTGLATVYLATGQPLSRVVTIPPASGNGTGSPAGLVSNTSASFKITEGNNTAPAQFLFSTLDGTISGWNPTVDPTHAVIAVKTGAVYTGLAIALTDSGNFLYAADSAGNKVDIYDGNFNLVRSFTDTSLPPGYSPYGVQVIGKTLYVAFAISFSRSVYPAGGGYVDTFDLSGGSQKNLVSNNNLNQPWGIALAPSNFGPLGGSLLIANLGSGTINAYNANTGTFLGFLEQNGVPIAIDGLWGITFVTSPSLSPPSKLYFTAGPGGYIHGLFGVITVN